MKNLIIALLFPLFSMGQYAATGIKDTVTAAILITDWDDNDLPHRAYVINGYAVREKYRYTGMPAYGEGMNSVFNDEMVVMGYLDYYKKPLGPGVIVWDDKLQYKRKY